MINLGGHSMVSPAVGFYPVQYDKRFDPKGNKMPAPIPVEQRRQIVERHTAGERLASISATSQISYNTVKKIWAHWRKYHKLTPNYEQARQKGTRQYGLIYERALAMKREHPTWGAMLIRLKLQSDLPDEGLPSERTLQRWFRAAGIRAAPKARQRGA
jgi:hypothetical protein